jgi:hypothetical protein
MPHEAFKRDATKGNHKINPATPDIYALDLSLHAYRSKSFMA